MKVAEYLNAHPAISKVNYNGLPEHPDFEVSNRQMKHPGAMMSFELKGGFDAGVKFMNKAANVHQDCVPGHLRHFALTSCLHVS